MSIFVKICGLRDAESVAAAVDAGADAVGFVFAKSPRRVSPQQAGSASQGIPPHMQRVAVMRHPSRKEWLAVLDEFAPDVLQTDIEDFAGLDIPPQVQRWPVIREGSAVAANDLPGVFVYEGTNSGAGEAVNWTRAAVVADRGRMILAGGLAADNVAAAIRTVRPWGVDVSSGVESKPGQKDVQLIQQFIGAVRAAENP
jgi:phosphoribosylanthranilate isomerase